jgi:hypothetical protein
MADDKLSRTVTQVLQTMRAWRNVEDPYPPAECYKDMDRAMNKEIKKIVVDAGYTLESFVQEVKERTTEKFVYDLGLEEVLI